MKLNSVQVKIKLRKSDSYVVFFKIRNELETLGILEDLSDRNKFKLSDEEYAYFKLKYPENIFRYET